MPFFSNSDREDSCFTKKLDGVMIKGTVAAASNPGSNPDPPVLTPGKLFNLSIPQFPYL